MSVQSVTDCVVQFNVADQVFSVVRHTSRKDDNLEVAAHYTEELVDEGSDMDLIGLLIEMSKGLVQIEYEGVALSVWEIWLRTGHILPVLWPENRFVESF